MIEKHIHGVLLAAIPYGEKFLRLHLLTEEYGHMKGLVYRDKRQLTQGMFVRGVWQAREENLLGFFRLDFSLPPTLMHLLSQSLPLFALMNICALYYQMLPERHPYPALFAAYQDFFKNLRSESWALGVISMEGKILSELGYGLSLKECAVTGRLDKLTHVSPNSGKAVCLDVARPYIEKLFILPPFLGCLLEDGIKEGSSFSIVHIVRCLDITGHFLKKLLPASLGLPYPRSLMIRGLKKQSSFQGQKMVGPAGFEPATAPL